MKILAISGSARRDSTNTALLMAMKALAPSGVELSVFHRLDELPVFSPDVEGEKTPPQVRSFMEAVAMADGILISSPEYVRAIPGGLKNAIDWMVSRDEIIGKPIALAHASHRGEDMLASLRRVLATVSEAFLERCFLRIPLLDKSPSEIADFFAGAEQEAQVKRFLSDFVAAIRARRA
jgi:NAD(P)H-dependent FMN reductase